MLAFSEIHSARPGDTVAVPALGRGLEAVEFVQFCDGGFICRPRPLTEPEYTSFVELSACESKGRAS